MPVFGIYDGERRYVEDIPFQEDAECPTCHGRLRKWRESTNGTIPHLKHIDGMGHGTSKSTTDCVTIHESEEHEHWKHLAAVRLEALFGEFGSVTEELRLEAPVSGKERRYADAAVSFEAPHDILGEGLAIEVQHKNEAKDIPETTADYLEQDYAVVWAYKNDFGQYRCKLDQTDIFHRAFEAAWPDSVPESKDWEHLSTDYQPLMHDLLQDSGVRTSRVPATLPTEWFDQTAQRLWRSREWEKLFPDTYLRRTAGDELAFLEDITSSQNRYSLSGWNLLAKIRSKNDRTTVRVPASLPTDWFDKTARSLWRTQEWGTLFSGVPSGLYITEVGDSVDSMAIPVTIPDTFLQELLVTGSEPPRPQTVFEDVQCRRCGRYWHVKDHREKCSHGGTPVDFEWNIETGRISRESLPDQFLKR